MKAFIYRVIFKISYNKTYFDFANVEDACKFVATALEHLNEVEGETDNPASMIIQVVYTEGEKE